MEEVNQLLTSTPVNQTGLSSNNSQELGREVFLQLLVTQLQSQDPTNPVENEEFIAQLAQFTTLEQANNTNDLLTQLVDQNVSSSQLDLVGMIGREVIAEGNTISLGATEDITLQYVLEGNARSVEIEILDSTGGLVARLQDLGSQADGNHSVVWDGHDFNDDRVEAGIYQFRVKAVDTEGNAVPTVTFLREPVNKVIMGSDGSLLVLASGTTLSSSDIQVIQ